MKQLARPGRTGALSCALAAVPIGVLLAARVIWHDAPTRIPDHWVGSGQANAFAPGAAVWVGCLVVAVLAAAAAFGIYFASAGDTPRSLAAKFGIACAIAAGAAVAWPTFEAVAARGLVSGNYNVGPQFFWFGTAILWGSLSFWAAHPFRSAPAART